MSTLGHNLPKQDLQMIKNIVDVRYGKCKLAFDRHTGLHYTVSDHFLQNPKQGTLLEKALKKRVQNPNLYYVPVHDYQIQTINQFCSKMTKAKIITAMPDEDLKKEIKKKAETRQPYTNMEMTFLLYDLVFGLAHMEDMGLNHGKFGPEWVALTTTGYAVMEDPLYFSTKSNGFMDLKGKKDVYLAPEVFHFAINHQPLPKGHDFLKADVFSAGLVMLEAGNLQRMKVIYGVGKRKEMFAGVLREKIERFKKRYPDNNLLLSTVARMVDLDPSKRPTFREIREKLPDYQLVKQHFLNNEDSAPVEDDYSAHHGYSTEVHDQEFGNPRNFQSQPNGFMKTNRLGGQGQIGLSMPRLPNRSSVPAGLSHNFDGQQGRRFGRPSRAGRSSVSPLRKQYGNRGIGNFTERSLPPQRQFGRHQSLSPMEGNGLRRNASWMPREQGRFGYGEEPGPNGEGHGLGPNPQYGSKKPMRRKEADLDEHPLSDPDDQSEEKMRHNQVRRDYTPDKKIVTKTSQVR
jgi:hypothetical protein